MIYVSQHDIDDILIEKLYEIQNRIHEWGHQIQIQFDPMNNLFLNFSFLRI